MAACPSLLDRNFDTLLEKPQWNFHKYLIGSEGRPVQSFDTKVAPGDPKLVAAIEKLLEQKTN